MKKDSTSGASLWDAKRDWILALVWVLIYNAGIRKKTI